MKIEVGKCYRTRDGRKTAQVSLSDNKHYPFFVISTGNHWTVTSDGSKYMGHDSGSDLIAEWSEPMKIEADTWLNA